IHGWLDGAPWQANNLGLLFAGNWAPPSWVEPPRQVQLEDLKGVIEWLAERLHLGPVNYVHNYAMKGVEHPHRVALARVGGAESTVIGRVGEFDPRYLAAYEIKAERAVFAVLDVAKLAEAAALVPQVRDVDRLPPVERDIAVIVGRDVAAADVEAAIRAHAGPNLAALALFDRYQGPPLGANEISLAYRLRFQPEDTPLTEAQVEQAVAAVTDALGREVGGRVRSGS
ncbi:MAG: hypothetical protein WD830_10200, partial [Chloroflexota bacterium]